MKFWLGVTDNTWFSYQEENRFDEVNFWQPSATPPFKNAPESMPFLFKLKRPNNHIVGGGFFVTYSTLPLSLAWEVFGEKNGTNSYAALKAIIEPLSKNSAHENMVGCTILANPFYFPREEWIPTPDSFASNIVRGKMYDTTSDDGQSLWHQVEQRLSNDFYVNSTKPKIAETGAKYGSAQLFKPRLGQCGFRLLVTEAYDRRCAITGESTLPVLEAAHIIPYSQEGTHDVSNGLLLRSDFHKLYDIGLVSITPELKIKISPQIRESWFNGKAYYRLQDCALASKPQRSHLMPNRESLKWHYENKFIRD